MNALFKNLSSDNLEAAEDRLGGGQSIFPTDYYLANVKLAYAGQAKSGAMNVTLILDIDGKELRETVYVTNKAGENFFTNKDDPKKKIGLPGFTLIDDLCLLTTGSPLSEQDTEEKVVKIYDYELKKEVPTAVQALTGVMGKEVGVAVLHVKEFKNKKDASGTYVPTEETREFNSLEKIFHHPSGRTAVEIRQEATEAAFKDAWIAKNQGKMRDKTAGKTPAGGKGATAGAPQAGAGRAKSSLFGNL